MGSSINILQRLRDLVPLPQVYVGTVLEIHDDDTSTVQIPGPSITDYAGNVAVGSLLRPRGTTVPVGKRAFVRAGVIETQAPDGEIADIEVGIVIAPPIVEPPTPSNPVTIDVDIWIKSVGLGTYRGALPGAWPTAPGGGQRVSSDDPIFVARPEFWFNRLGAIDSDSLVVDVGVECDPSASSNGFLFPPHQFPAISSGSTQVVFTIVDAPDPTALNLWVNDSNFANPNCAQALFGDGNAVSNYGSSWSPITDVSPVFAIGDVLTVDFDLNSLFRVELRHNGVNYVPGGVFAQTNGGFDLRVAITSSP